MQPQSSTAFSSAPTFITFSSGLRADDEGANYWLRQVTLRLRREICWAWHERGVFPGSHSDTLPPFAEKVPAILDMARFAEQKANFYRNDPTARYLTEQLGAAPAPANHAAPYGSLSWVIGQLNLDPAACFVLALGIAAAFDNAMSSVIAACLNDPVKDHPNLALAQRLWDHPEQLLAVADPAHTLFRHGLLLQNRACTHGCAALDWESQLAVHPLVAAHLLFPDGPLPDALRGISSPVESNVAMTETVHLVALRLSCNDVARLCIVPIRGAKGSAHTEVAAGVAALTKRKIVSFQGDPAVLENTGFLSALATLCWLKGWDLFLDPDRVQALTNSKSSADGRWLPLQTIPVTIFLGITDRAQLASVPQGLMLPIIEAASLTYGERVQFWQQALGTKAKGLELAIAECSRRFRFEKTAINAISAGLKVLSRSITAKDLMAACRSEMEVDIGELAQRVKPRFDDEELILPHDQSLQFQEIVQAMKALTQVHYEWGTARAWNEGGISVLFAGPPGTGKTMAAEILATKLDLPIYRIDLSQVVNKYIGETEKNLKRLFDAADVSDTILFFDEADSLFGKRTEVKDAHDRYANLEISYLLERMERFKGLAILATNRKKDLDEAFLRRLRYILDFPIPEVEQREKIWRQVVPKAVEASEIEFHYLAKQFPLAGGHIRSIVFNACLQCANGTLPADGFRGKLTMEQIIIAVKREYDKLNRAVSLEQFGPYAAIIKGLEHETNHHPRRSLEPSAARDFA